MMSHNEKEVTGTGNSPVADLEINNHNSSAQEGVQLNPDPVLDTANEHHHAHLHHGGNTGGKDDVVFANSDEKYPGSAPGADYKVRTMSSSNDDEESGGGVGEVRSSEEEENVAGWRGWTFKRVYRQYKFVFHFAFWAVWTA